MLLKMQVNPIKSTLFTARRQSRIFRLYMHVPKEASLKQTKSFNIMESSQFSIKKRFALYLHVN